MTIIERTLLGISGILALSGCLQATIMGQQPAGGSSTSLGTSAFQINSANRIFSANETYPVTVSNASGQISFSLLSGAGALLESAGGTVFEAPATSGATSIEAMDSAGQSATATFQSMSFSPLTDQEWMGISVSGSFFDASSFYAECAATDSSGNLYVVGWNGGDWYVAEWSGSTWSVLDDTNFPTYANGTWTQAGAYAVAADKLGNVYVAGYVENGNASGSYYNLVRQWNGSTWTTIDAEEGDFTGTYALGVDGQNNVYLSECLDTSGTWSYVLKEWNGTSWTTIADRNSNGFIANGFGQDSSGNLLIAAIATGGIWTVASWNGSSWNVLDTYSGSTGAGASANSVGTDSLGNIYAAGNSFDGVAPHLVVREWQGSAWSTVNDYVYPDSDSYDPGSNTLAIDSSNNVYVSYMPYLSSVAPWLVSHWLVIEGSGSTWNTISDIASNSTTFMGYNVVTGFAADRHGNVYAVGAQNSMSSQNWSVEEWNGSTWTALAPYVQTSPALSTSTSPQAMIASGGNVYAAGFYGDALGNHWLVGKYALGAWSTSDDYLYPPGGSNGAMATAIAGSGDSLYVAGSGYTSSYDHWLVRSWNGSTWSLSDDYTYPSGQGANAAGVAVDGFGNVYAAGSGNDSTGMTHWIVRQWSGSSWNTSDDYLYPGGQGGGAAAVAANVDGDVAVVGTETDGSGNAHWVVRQWHNSSWSTLDDFQYPSGQWNAPQTAGYDSSGNLYVGGMTVDSSGTTHNVLREWNGSSWSTVVDETPENGTNSGYTSLTIDSQGNAYAAFAMSSTGALQVDKWNGFSVTASDQVSPPNGSGGFGSSLLLTIDSVLGTVYSGVSYADTSGDMHWSLRSQGIP